MHSEKVQKAVGVATDFIDKQQMHHDTFRTNATQGLLKVADIAQKDKHKQIDTAADLFKHQTNLLQQHQTPEGGTEE